MKFRDIDADQRYNIVSFLDNRRVGKADNVSVIESKYYLLSPKIIYLISKH